MSSIFDPYLAHPLVKNIDPVLQELNTNELNDVIFVEDLLISGVREKYLSGEEAVGPTGRKLNPGAFSGSINIARALSCIDAAHTMKDISKYPAYVKKVTPTNSKPSAIKASVMNKHIPNLENLGIITLDESKRYVSEVMPYPVSSKYYVLKKFLNNPMLYSQQVNQFDIMRAVMSFPENKKNIESEITDYSKFDRDFYALYDYDIIRTESIGNTEYVFSKAYITKSKEALDTWRTILDSSNRTRQPLNELMNLLGDYSGFMSSSEIESATGYLPRHARRLMRLSDKIGISNLTHSLDMTDAISRPIPGSLLTRNYVEFNNAPSIMVLTRQEEFATDILNELINSNLISEDDLYDKYPSSTIQRVSNSLKAIGLLNIEELGNGNLKLAENKGSEDLIHEILTLSANSRRIISPDHSLNDSLKESLSKTSLEDIEKETKQMTLQFYQEEIKSSRA